jgi:hypothetical protein
MRRCASGFFRFTISLPRHFLLGRRDDSVLFEPAEPFQVHLRGDCTATIGLPGHSIFFDGRGLVFQTGLGGQSSIGLDCTIYRRSGSVVMVVERDGHVTEGGRRDELPVIFTQEFATKRPRMIRSAHIEDSSAKTERMIFHEEAFSIIQSAESIASDVAGFPLATWQAGALSLAVGRLTFTCGEGVSGVTGVGESVALSFRGGRLSVTTGCHAMKKRPCPICR